MNDKQFNKAKNERRFKILWVSMEKIMSMLTSGHIESPNFIIDKIKISDTYRAVDVFYSPSRRAFGFTIISSAYKTVPLGDEFIAFSEGEATEIQLTVKTDYIKGLVDKKTMEELE